MKTRLLLRQESLLELVESVSGVAASGRVLAIGSTALLGFVLNRVNVGFRPRRLRICTLRLVQKKNTIFPKLDLLPSCGDRVSTGPVTEQLLLSDRTLYMPSHLVTWGPQLVQFTNDVFFLNTEGIIVPSTFSSRVWSRCVRNVIEGILQVPNNIWCFSWKATI